MPALTLPLLWGLEEFSCSSVEAEIQVDPSHTWHRLPEVCGCYQEGEGGQVKGILGFGEVLLEERGASHIIPMAEERLSGSSVKRVIYSLSFSDPRC